MGADASAKRRWGSRVFAGGARRAVLTSVMMVAGTVACNETPNRSGSGRIADVQAGGPLGADDGVALEGDRALRTLARAAGGPDGRQYTVTTRGASGVLVGRVRGGSPRDTSITPTHDLSVCRPFTETVVPSREGGVGNSVVWLVGVASGPAIETPRVARLMLDGCRISPRVVAVAAGGTVMLTSRDAMMSRLQFEAMGEGQPSRATVLFTDAGQVVPTSVPTITPGLVRVRDDLHPWVRAYLVVTPHPFVAITDADGEFRFDGVPVGRYTLLVWHERLGVKSQRVRVESGIEARVEMKY